MRKNFFYVSTTREAKIDPVKEARDKIDEKHFALVLFFSSHL